MLIQVVSRLPIQTINITGLRHCACGFNFFTASCSAFAGLSANSPFWNCLLAFCMFVGRFGVIIPVMAIVGSLVSKKSQPASSGTLPTHGPLFVGLLIGTVLLR
ncbi:potassium-transporting ATPase subunit KdpA [Bacillus sp. HC-Mk]